MVYIYIYIYTYVYAYAHMSIVVLLQMMHISTYESSQDARKRQAAQVTVLGSRPVLQDPGGPPVQLILMGLGLGFRVYVCLN